MQQLPIFLNLAGKTVILLGDGDSAAAKKRLYTRAGALLTSDEQADAVLAVVAIEEADAAEAATARLRARGLLVNVVDRPEHCDFTTPAIVDRDPLLLAIGTGGASAGLAKALRQRLEALLPASIGALAEGLFAARDVMRVRWPDASARRAAIDVALAEGGPLDVLRPFSPDQMDDWLSADAAATQAETVELAFSSADPDEMSLRAARLLSRADRIHVAADFPAGLLARVRADALHLPLTDTPPATDGLTLILRMEGTA
ncbi:MAG: bifunctional precorrin-2 dehydrogenase/sirohydrochlorin ferrochelatase [Parasphingorhabdus sp.]|nr:bifunctional precorrin-2 dehydrogenase/sirohydrochlorin ferrochelatase [Parasphingorhabdus sp.]